MDPNQSNQTETMMNIESTDSSKEQQEQIQLQSEIQNQEQLKQSEELNTQNQQNQENNNEVQQQQKQKVDEKQPEDKKSETSEKVQQQTQQQQDTSNKKQNSKQQKTVTVTVDELLKWDKKSKELQATINSLKIENSNMKIELQEKTNLLNAQQKRQEISNESLEERCKALQNILDKTSLNYQQSEIQLQALQTKNVGLQEDFDAREKELKSLREVIKDKFELERNLKEKQQQCEELLEKFKQQEIERQQIEENNNYIQKLQAENENLYQTKVDLEQKLFQTETELTQIQAQLNEKIKQGELQEQKNKLLESENEHLKNSLEDTTQQLQHLRSQNDDLNAETLIIQKKYKNEIKELKSAILIEKNQIETYKTENEKQQRDLQNLMDRLKIFDTQSFKKFGSKESKQEKIIVEALSIKNNELEIEKKKLQDQKNQLIQVIEQQNSKIEDKNQLIKTLVFERSSNNPELDEIAQEIDSEDAQYIIKSVQLSQFQQQSILEKTLIENFRLKKDLMMLGQELNQIMRDKMNMK